MLPPMSRVTDRGFLTMADIRGKLHEAHRGVKATDGHNKPSLGLCCCWCDLVRGGEGKRPHESARKALGNGWGRSHDPDTASSNDSQANGQLQVGAWRTMGRRVGGPREPCSGRIVSRAVASCSAADGLRWE